MSEFWGKAKGVLATVAPALGTAIGGPMGGVAARAIASVLLGDENAKEDAVAAAVLNASPDQLLALKKADYDFQQKMAELDVDLERIAVSDRDSARKREVETKDRTPGILALGVFFGFFGILASLMFVDIPEAGREPLMIMLGALGTLVTQIANYVYGSSSGSSAKQKMLDRVLPTAGGR